MTKETGTLADLNVKPGDVFELINLMFEPCTLQSDGRILIGDGPEYYGRYPEKGHLMACIVSRATPKTWGDMTDEEKGALLLAHHQGKVIEFVNDCDVRDWKKAVPRWADFCSYRVRPEPKRETVTLWGRFDGFDQGWGFFTRLAPYSTHRITLPLLDGNIPAGTYTSEAGETIIVEEL
jgi:hypothetical protein